MATVANIVSYLHNQRAKDIYIISFVPALYRVFIPCIGFLSEPTDEQKTVALAWYYFNNSREHMDIIEDAAEYAELEAGMSPQDFTDAYNQFDIFAGLDPNKQQIIQEAGAAEFNLHWVDDPSTPSGFTLYNDNIYQEQKLLQSGGAGTPITLRLNATVQNGTIASRNWIIENVGTLSNTSVTSTSTTTTAEPDDTYDIEWSIIGSPAPNGDDDYRVTCVTQYTDGEMTFTTMRVSMYFDATGNALLPTSRLFIMNTNLSFTTEPLVLDDIVVKEADGTDITGSFGFDPIQYDTSQPNDYTADISTTKGTQINLPYNSIGEYNTLVAMQGYMSAGATGTVTMFKVKIN